LYNLSFEFKQQQLFHGPLYRTTHWSDPATETLMQNVTTKFVISTPSHPAHASSLSQKSNT